jgi:hypothetical protein
LPENVDFFAQLQNGFGLIYRSSAGWHNPALVRAAPHVFSDQSSGGLWSHRRIVGAVIVRLLQPNMSVRNGHEWL